jgi:phosphoribosylglycinamide formyltransferase-1
LGVLVSGRGSNLQAILDAAQTGRLRAELRVVISDRADAEGLARARQAGVPAIAVDPGGYRTRFDAAGEEEIVALLRRHEVELVVLAGFMRVVHEPLLRAYTGAIINIHPSLLPAFPGLDAQRQALERGVKITGCTVHFVEAGVDQGPIIAQRPVPVLKGDTRDVLADRILVEEHRLLVEVLDAFAAGRVRRAGRGVWISAPGAPAVPAGSGSPVAARSTLEVHRP